MVIDFVRCSHLRKLVEKWERMGAVKTKGVLAMTFAQNGCISRRHRGVG